MESLDAKVEELGFQETLGWTSKLGGQPCIYIIQHGYGL